MNFNLILRFSLVLSLFRVFFPRLLLPLSHLWIHLSLSLVARCPTLRYITTLNLHFLCPRFIILLVLMVAVTAHRIRPTRPA